MTSASRQAAQPTDVAKLLAQGKSVELAPSGTSMWPTLIPGRDRVQIMPLQGAPRTGDIVLYRRPMDSPLGQGGCLVLHRLVRHDAQGLWLRGDNQFVLEGPLPPDSVLGIMTARVREGKILSCDALAWRAWGIAWGAALPLRKLVRLIRQRSRTSTTHGEGQN